MYRNKECLLGLSFRETHMYISQTIAKLTDLTTIDDEEEVLAATVV